LALTVATALAGVAVLMSVLMLLVEPKPVPGLDLAQRQDAETAVYAAALLVILPLALVAAPRLADRIAAGPNAAALSPLTALLVSTLAAAIVLVRLSALFGWGGGSGALLCAGVLWSVAAAAALARAARDRPWRGLLQTAGLARGLWLTAGVMVLASLLTVTQLESISPLPLALGAVVIPASVLLLGRGRLPRLRGRWGLLADVLVAGLVLLAAPDLVTIEPENPAASSLDLYVNAVVRFHHDFLLGPANQVLGGSPMLVDTASQYGVGSILFLAGWFKLAPIGYGTLAFLDGLVTALFLVAGYCLLRVGGASRLLATSAMAVAVAALVFNRLYPVGALPQEGPLRFGLGLGVILATVAGARLSQRSRAVQPVALAILALSSIWALEAFALTAAAFASMACFQAYLRPPGDRLGWLARQAARAGVACACAHLLFAAATLAGTGRLPDWGHYLAYLRAFLFTDLGDLTYDFSRWSPGLAVGALYMASAAALILLLRRRPDVVRRERIALLALTGTTAYGIVLFGYYVDRSGDHVLPYVGLPALLVGALWLGVLLRSRTSLPRAVAAEALAFALAVAVLLLAVAWSSIGPRFERSALAHAVPGGESTRAALDRLWHFPPLDPGALEGERLLERYIPGERRTVVLIKPSRVTETLMRSGRANRLPIGDPIEDGFVMDRRKPLLRDAVAELESGDRVLVDRGHLDALATVRENPASDLLVRLPRDVATAPLQVFALQQIDARFRLRPVYSDGVGLTVARLAPRG
jgi:hypothetical protein